jgi:hypothetical protein
VSPDGRIEQAVGVGNHSDPNSSALIHGAGEFCFQSIDLGGGIHTIHHRHCRNRSQLNVTMIFGFRESLLAVAKGTPREIFSGFR